MEEITTRLLRLKRSIRIQANRIRFWLGLRSARFIRVVNLENIFEAVIKPSSTRLSQFTPNSTCNWERDISMHIKARLCCKNGGQYSWIIKYDDSVGGHVLSRYVLVSSSLEKVWLLIQS